MKNLTDALCESNFGNALKNTGHELKDIDAINDLYSDLYKQFVDELDRTKSKHSVMVSTSEDYSLYCDGVVLDVDSYRMSAKDMSIMFDKISKTEGSTLKFHLFTMEDIANYAVVEEGVYGAWDNSVGDVYLISNLKDLVEDVDNVDEIIDGSIELLKTVSSYVKSCGVNLKNVDAQMIKLLETAKAIKE